MKNKKLFEKNKKNFIKMKESEEGFEDYFQKINYSLETFETDPIRLDWITAFQDKMAFSILMRARQDIIENTSIQKDHSFILDVGSKFSTVVQFSNILKTFFLECRNEIPEKTITEIPGMNLGVINAEAQNIGFLDGTVPILTCLHAMEHFGLGRYGDQIDYFGDQKAMKEFSRIIHDEGYLLLSVPFTISDSNRIEYHSQRVYDYKTVDAMLEKEGFEKVANWFIFPLGGIRDDDGEVMSPIIINSEYVDALEPSPTAANDFGVYLTLSRKKEVEKEGLNIDE